ncbi:MAG: glycosyltransferase family 4 protein [Anaerolineales bacterium]|nr:glycosyltransferase family 4 protein [Anaerolineales bacterium]
MKLLFVADGRSPIALNWITYFISRGDEVHLATTFSCKAVEGLASQTIIPVAFSSASGPATSAPGRAAGGARAIKLRSTIRHWVGPLTIPSAARQLTKLVEHIRPDLVHAMRIPYEGMLAAASDPGVPLLVSIWGNDFTLHAPASPLMQHWTRRVLRRADALQTDCRRDLHLAHALGFPDTRPELVVPGNGGIRPEIFRPQRESELPSGRVAAFCHDISPETPVIVNPRGFRAYVRNDTFFRAVPLIRERHPSAVFLCPSMAGESEAEGWIRRVQAGEAVRLLPSLAPEEMAQVYHRSMISVSVSEHDGTPNTLLEAMACDCFPVAGDLDSIGEWIQDGVNGSLVNPSSPEDLAGAVVAAIEGDESRKRALQQNRELIRDRAAQPQVMKKITAFYELILAS